MLLPLLSLVGLALACADNELHSRDAHARIHTRREYPQFPLTPPHRPLVWGDFNVIHTTDTHGWLLGHQKPVWPEPNYSGDLGDFASFVTHMKRIAIDKNVDLLLVDSGDLHDGTGLSDGYPPGSVDAHDSNKFLERLPYDVMAIGNHELYVYANAYDMYTNFVPQLNGRYLSSNVNITVFNSNGQVVSVPIGNRYVKFTTAKGRRVTSLGVLYNFNGNSVNTTVQTVATMVKQKWFADAIADEPDIFVLVGHMPVSNDNWPTVFNAIRAVHPHTPIMIFGVMSVTVSNTTEGQWLWRAVATWKQSARSSLLMLAAPYRFTGWMSADLGAAIGNTNNITFTRRYLDQNRVTYEYHTTMSNSTFDTADGQNITSGLQQLAIDFDLSYFYGTAPQTYTMNQDSYPSSGNVLTLYITEAAPVALAINNTRAGIPNIIITNSGQLRYNVFAGHFTKNDQLTVVPFTNSFYYIPNVPLSVATQILPGLNDVMLSKRSEGELWDRGYVEGRYRKWLSDMHNHKQQTIVAANLTPGYVTTDGCPDVGDDTLHMPQPQYSVPSYISSNPPNVASNTPIDLVFVSFIESTVLSTLNSVQSTTMYTSADVSLYTPTLANEVLGLYAQAKWN